MELLAVERQVFVRHCRVRDAGVDVRDVLQPQCTLERVVQKLAEPEMLCVGADIYACLHSPCVGGALLERGCVGVAHYLPATLCNKVGIPAERMLDALSELLYRRDFIFKGDGRVFHVGRIDCQQLLRVLASCNSHMAAFHAAYLFSSDGSSNISTVSPRFQAVSTAYRVNFQTFSQDCTCNNAGLIV